MPTSPSIGSSDRKPEVIPPDNRWGFRMDVPELLYNRGELHNLSISRGTLTAEERYKINEHMVQTIVMLNELPFPRHLRTVPEIAGGHHEKMDGTGYPKRLDRDQLSPLARMMAIADIFEALTAADRPYKPGKTLIGSVVDHGQDVPGQARRPRTVRAVPARRRVPRIRAALHARRAD